MSAKRIHQLTFIIGLLLFTISLYLAVVQASQHFYTWFALGSWLILDWWDYKLTGYSTLGYFLRRKSWDAFIFFFIVTGIFCFIIDIVYGVHITQLWTWGDYGLWEYLRMIVIMNVSFLFSVVELFRIVNHFTAKVIADENFLKLRIADTTKRAMYGFFIFISLVSYIVIPIVSMAGIFDEYLMFFPFLAMFILTDALTYFTNGNPLTDKIIRGNKLFITSFLISWLILAPLTELANLYGNEWEYLRMPFESVTVFAGIPLAVFLGWIPLMLGAISTLNLIKHLNYLQDNGKLNLSLV
jgi:hypothetical protein